jgi:putative transposase
MAATRARLGIQIGAFVVMPEHVHVLVRCPEGVSVSGVLGSLKRPVSARAKAWLVEHEPEWIDRLTVVQGKRRVFRFWQAGGGFDRNIWEQRTLAEVVEYIHTNPLRRRLVERPTDWVWSSARFWAGMEGVLEMDRIG